MKEREIDPSSIGALRSASADPGVTPVRLYQLFAGLGSGSIVVQKTAAQILKDRGWTVSEVKLQPDEISFISSVVKLQGQDPSIPTTVHFARCEGIPQEDAKGQVSCTMPGRLERTVVRLKDARPELVAPALIFLPSSPIAGVAAITVKAGAASIPELVQRRAREAAGLYSSLVKIYSAYTEYLLTFPDQGPAPRWERNTALQIRNLLGKLAVPAALAGVNMPMAGSVSPLGGEGCGDEIGLVFATNSPQAAQALLARALGKLKATLAAAHKLSQACCGRLLAVMERRSPLAWAPGAPQGQRLREAGARLLANFGCRPMQELVVEGPPVKELAIAGGVLVFAGLALHGWRRWTGARDGALA